MLKRVLIANRGEIARRIARTCRRLGIEYVAVYSDADRSAAHLSGAVERVRIGGSAAADSYLSVTALVDAAVRTGCDAVHPGYGFLSESPAFAEAVAEAELVYVGPTAAMIAAMGDKATARELMARAGVPILPGSAQATESAGQLLADAERIGYPVILKPVAGGGGKGMQVVHGPAEVAEAVAAAVRLGRSSFGDGRLLAERYVSRPRHIEVQVVGDTHGSVVHLFERECSLQRRHQKVVEEAPAPNLPAGVRQELLDAAVRGAAALGYVNAGTFEFILDEDGRFFFLEANTRLQVEHPVTEEITGIDLVEWQLRIADGERLPLAQHEITASGHALECRVYAEDPEAGFRPAPGRAETVEWPVGVRVEAAFDESGDVPPFYDPMIAKLIARGPDRASALRLLVDAVRSTALLGLTTNLGFLAELLQEPRVVAGRLDTHLVDGLAGTGAAAGLAAGADGGAGGGHGEGSRDDRARAAAACAAAMEVPVRDPATDSPWTAPTGPMNRQDLDPQAPFGRVLTRDATREWEARLTGVDRRALRVEVDGRTLAVTSSLRDGVHRGSVGDRVWAGIRTADGFELVIDGYRSTLRSATVAAGAAEAAGNAVTSTMPGTVVGVSCAVGDRVEAGDVLVVVEAMKMENRLTAPIAGVVEAVNVRLNDLVAADQILVSLADEAAPPAP
jgi:acetyl-CoA/propionyl-CoA carboxylase, biotin carboxylase, biotin carboxyl carrier protein